MSSIERMSGMTRALSDSIRTAEARDGESGTGNRAGFTIGSVGGASGIAESKGMQLIERAYDEISAKGAKGEVSYADLNLIGMRATQRLIGVKDSETMERSSQNLEELKERVQERAERAAEAQEESVQKSPARQEDLYSANARPSPETTVSVSTTTGMDTALQVTTAQSEGRMTGQVNGTPETAAAESPDKSENRSESVDIRI